MQLDFRNFRAAARHIGVGWCQGFWRNGNDVCLLQAVIDAMGIKDDAAETKEALLPWAVLAEIDVTLMQTGSYCISDAAQGDRKIILHNKDVEALAKLIWGWNDAEGRTQGEVIHVLQTTADRLEAKSQVWLRDLMKRAVRPASRYYVEDDELAFAVD